MKWIEFGDGEVIRDGEKGEFKNIDTRKSLEFGYKED